MVAIRKSGSWTSPPNRAADAVVDVSLAAELQLADHTNQRVQKGSFTPTTSEIEVQVEIQGALQGVAHVNSIFIWNQAVAANAELRTGRGSLTSPYVAGTSYKRLGAFSSPGNVGRMSKTFKITGLTPGVPLTWELLAGSTGYFDPKPVGNTPLDLCFASDNETIYVTCYDSNEIWVMDTARYWDNKGLARHVDTWGDDLYGPYGICAHPTDATLVYVTNFNDANVQERDAETGDVIREFTGLTGPTFIACDGTRLFVVSQGASTITPITLATGAVGAPWTTSTSPRKPVIAGTGTYTSLYVPCPTGNAVDHFAIGTNDARFARSTGAGTGPLALAIVPPANSMMWVLQPGNSKLREMSLVTFDFTGVEYSLPILASGADVNVSPSGKSLYVTAGGTGHNWLSFLNPPVANVQYEGGNTPGDAPLRMITSPKTGDCYFVDWTADQMPYFQGANLIMDPDDGFWGGIADVRIKEIQ